MAGKFVLRKTSNGQYMFNLKAANGETILTSETYASKSGAENGIASVRTNAPSDARYDRRQDTAGKWYFVLKAMNHEIIGKSESYSSRTAMENGIQDVKATAPTAGVEDLT